MSAVAAVQYLLVSSEPDLSPLVPVAHAVAAEWNLELGDPFALALRSFVAPAGDDAVLKLTPTEDDESNEEAEALELWDGDGAVRLLRHDRARRAMLLERARPGTDIGRLPDDEATAIAVRIGRTLWRPADRRFRWIGDHVPRWLENAEGEGAAAREVIKVARELYGSVQPRTDTLVHGDFHHHNILDAGDRHIAIDPKPMLGEPEFDVPSFLWNPLWNRMRLDVTERRIAAFAAAGLDETRIRAWTVIRGAYLRASDPDVLRVLRELV